MKVVAKYRYPGGVIKVYCFDRKKACELSFLLALDKYMHCECLTVRRNWLDSNHNSDHIYQFEIKSKEMGIEKLTEEVNKMISSVENMLKLRNTMAIQKTSTEKSE